MRRLSWIRLLLVGIAAGVAAACGKDVSPVAPPTRPARPVPGSLTLDSLPGVLIIGAPPTTVVVVARDTAGHVVPNALIQWSNSNPHAVEGNADASGKPFFWAPYHGEPQIADSAVITVHWGGTQPGTYVEVRRTVLAVPGIRSMELMATPNLRSVGSRDSLQLIAFSSGPSLGKRVTSLPVTWTSSNPSVISISPAGALVARSVGTATLTTTMQGFTVSSSMLVIPPYRANWISAAGAHPAVLGLNDNGSILGQEDAAYRRYFVARTDGSIHYLLGCTKAFNITNNERVLCQTVGPDGAQRLAIWEADSLRVLDGVSGSVVQAIMNDSGDVALLSWSNPSPCAHLLCVAIWRDGQTFNLTPPYFPTRLVRFDPDERLMIQVYRGYCVGEDCAYGIYTRRPDGVWDGTDTGGGYAWTVTAANRDGVAVGGDTSSYGSAFYRPPGGTVQWFAPGIASSINDATYVVGAFVLPSYSLATDGYSIVRINGAFNSPVQRLLLDSTWIIDRPYFVDNSNRIVAQAHRSLGGQSGLILLTPESTTSSATSSATSRRRRAATRPQ